MRNQNEAYIVGGYRSPITKAGKGGFRFVRPDDLAAKVVSHLVASFPQLDKERIDDVIVGNAMPEAEQGLNIGRMISLMGLNTDKVPGMTVNRYCSSGLETIAIAKAKIEAGMADCIIAGGVESMSIMAMGGWRIVPNPKVGKEHPSWYWSMGLTAEEVAKEFNVSRADQDEFALASHRKALLAIENGVFKPDIVPIQFDQVYLDENEKKQSKTVCIDTDEGPRPSTLGGLAQLKPAFSANGSVTAGNSSQTSDGAAFVLVMSEKMVKELNISPLAKLVSYAVCGVAPKIMGIGPVEAIPKALKMAGLSLADIALIELNEAFASQSIAVQRSLNLNTDILNVHGGAIALGHPLGCTGAKLSLQLINDLKRRNQRFGIVSMCVGTGQGAAGIFEIF
jgi:acetyl-CoA acyltransferase